jgi:hypothetical protein
MTDLRCSFRFLGLTAAVLCLPALAAADVPGSEFTYQGTLNVAGLPADGTYDFAFELFDVATGNSISSVSTHLDVTVSDGVFSIPDVDFGEDMDIAQIDAEMEIRVRESGGSTFTTLSPRTPLTATPLASHLRGVGVNLNPHGAFLRTYDGDVLGARWGTAPTGSGSYQGYARPESQNVLTATLDADRDNDPDNGVAEARLFLRGAGSGAVGGKVQVGDAEGNVTIALNGGLSGNPALQVPDGAVDAMETRDEPGVTSAVVSGQATTLNPGFGSPTVLESEVISCPADGYVLVIGTCQLTARHVTGYRSFYEFGVTDENTMEFPPNQDVAITIPSSEPDGNRAYVVTVHGLFPVAEGDHGFALMGRQYEGGQTGEVWDVQFTAIYFATAYGAVTGTAAGAADREAVAGYPGPTADPGAGSAADLRRRDDLERELAAVRRELAELRSLVTGDGDAMPTARAAGAAPFDRSTSGGR